MSPGQHGNVQTCTALYCPEPYRNKPGCLGPKDVLATPCLLLTTFTAVMLFDAFETMQHKGDADCVLGLYERTYQRQDPPWKACMKLS